MARIVLIVLSLVAGFMFAAIILVSLNSGRVNARFPIILGAIVLVATLAVASAVIRGGGQPRARRRSSGEANAERLGLTLTKKPDAELASRCRLVPGSARSGKVSGVYEGFVGDQELLVFTNTYVVQTGHAPISVPQTIYALRIPEWPSTRVGVRTRSRRFLDRLMRRKRFELENPAFNDAFTVRSNDEAFAATLLSPEVQEFLLDKTRGVSWRIGQGYLCLIYPGALRPDRMEASLRRLEGLWGLIPDELKSWSAHVASDSSVDEQG